MRFIALDFVLVELRLLRLLLTFNVALAPLLLNKIANFKVAAQTILGSNTPALWRSDFNNSLNSCKLLPRPPWAATAAPPVATIRSRVAAATCHGSSFWQRQHVHGSTGGVQEV